MESTSTKLITRWTDTEPIRVEDELVVEEPLEVRVGQESFDRCNADPGTRF